MDVFAVTFERNIVECHMGIHNGALRIDRQAYPQVVQRTFGRNDDRGKKQFMRLDIGKMGVNIP